ncbi:hypothetical protein Psuf_029270 [Phytohabitans suffuscus]|uniref:Uncharacterized protein n=1 Tax=Phytohabitans suffuscus TaxID=624315 RepID=A0A6F8YHJ5_9ACTN|nr:hypothetical protein Psuf_029270 [Phytohabitans suffuscus]
MGRARAGVALISAIGRAGSAGMRELTTRPAAIGPVTVHSTTEPHSPHSGQRPTHLGGWCPQASHSYAGRGSRAEVRGLAGVRGIDREVVTRAR